MERAFEHGFDPMVREVIREQRPDLDVDSLTRLERFVDDLADGRG